MKFSCRETSCGPLWHTAASCSWSLCPPQSTWKESCVSAPGSISWSGPCQSAKAWYSMRTFTCNKRVYPIVIENIRHSIVSSHFLPCSIINLLAFLTNLAMFSRMLLALELQTTHSRTTHAHEHMHACTRSHRQACTEGNSGDVTPSEMALLPCPFRQPLIPRIWTRWLWWGPGRQCPGRPWSTWGVVRSTGVDTSASWLPNAGKGTVFVCVLVLQRYITLESTLSAWPLAHRAKHRQSDQKEWTTSLMKSEKPTQTMSLIIVQPNLKPLSVVCPGCTPTGSLKEVILFVKSDSFSL